jgi:hypothetical protein
MSPRHLLTLPMLACAALSACASPGDYPSLAVREGERIAGSMEAPPTPAFTPAPPSPGTLDEVSELVARVRTAQDAFAAAAEPARTRATAARGAPLGSEEWSVAQVEIAHLESIRSAAMIALADLDRLYVDAAVSGGETERIGTARAQAVDLVDQQDALIASLLAMLAG